MGNADAFWSCMASPAKVISPVGEVPEGQRGAVSGEERWQP